MSAKTMKAARRELVEQAQALIPADRKTLTREARTKFDNLMTQAEAMQEDIDRIERVELASRPPRSQPNSMNGANSEVRDAFTSFLRSGEVRSILTSNSGGVLIPREFNPTLIAAQLNWGAIVGAVNQRNTETGAAMDIALTNDTANGLTPLAEMSPAPTVDPPFSSKQSVTETYTTGEVVISNQELEDSYFPLDSFLQDAFGKRYYRGLASLITNGSTSGSVESLLSTATLGATSGGAAAITYDDIIALYGSLDAAYEAEASWVMSSQTRATLMGVKDNIGRPLLTNAVDGGFSQLLGRPIVINEFMPKIGAGNRALLFGSVKAGYTLRTVGGLAIKRSTELYMRQNATAFYGFCRVSGFATDAGTHPIKALQQKAS